MKEAEERIQSQCYVWFHNTYTELRGLLCYNLNNSKNAIDGAKNKALGLQKGRSDLVFYYSGKAFMIEMKVEKGVQSVGQKEWQKKIEGQGFNYYIVRSLEDFKVLILKLLT